MLVEHRYDRHRAGMFDDFAGMDAAVGQGFFFSNNAELCGFQKYFSIASFHGLFS